METENLEYGEVEPTYRAVAQPASADPLDGEQGGGWTGEQGQQVQQVACSMFIYREECFFKFCQ